MRPVFRLRQGCKAGTLLHAERSAPNRGTSTTTPGAVPLFASLVKHVPPLSLYGSTKLASETLALEYGAAYGFPVWINRCGVLAGAGQFGTAKQGIFLFWLHAWHSRRPLRYIGFGGK